MNGLAGHGAGDRTLARSGKGRARRVAAWLSIGWMLLLALPAGRAWAQDPAGLVAFFQDNLIPVQQVRLAGEAVSVTYELVPVKDQAGLQADILYILGRVAGQYPASQTIHIDCNAGGETLFEYEVATDQILAYATGNLDDDQALSSIEIRNRSAASGLMGRSSGILTWGIGASLVAAGALAGLVLARRSGKGWLPRRSRGSRNRAGPGDRQRGKPHHPPAGQWGTLSLSSGTAPARIIGLDKPVAILGRSAACDVVLREAAVSRQHAEIRYQDGKAVLRDLGSSNGTFVNGQRLTGSRVLRPGDILQLGPCHLRFGPAGTVGGAHAVAGEERVTPVHGTGMPRPTGWGQLTVRQGESQPRVFRLGDAAQVRLGRSRDNDLVVLDDIHVSRHHAMILLGGTGPEIIDLDSTGGLWVNGRRVSRAWLRPGDHIRVGNTDFLYQAEGHC